MPTLESITPEMVEFVREKIDGSLSHPALGKIMEDLFNTAIQSMIGFRVQRELGASYPANPDNLQQREIVYDQRSCEIYKGNVFVAQDIWESHNDIRARGEIPPTESRVSGQCFYVKNLPPVPVIRCDESVPEQDLPELKKRYVLIDPNYKVL
jgi:hypothetical protein